MRHQHFQCFLTAWSVVSLCNAALNGYAGDLPSLPYRAVALGALLLVASAAHSRDWAASPLMAGRLCDSRPEAAVYIALLAALAGPRVAWRYLAPLDAPGVASLNHGASIVFVFGALTLVLTRAASHARDRTWGTSSTA